MLKIFSKDKFPALFLLSFIFLSTNSQSASFNCAKAGTKIEKMICSSSSLNKLDSDLAEHYKEALGKEPSVRQDQLSWIKDRNKCENTTCLEDAYKERIDSLVNFIVRYDREAMKQDQDSSSSAQRADKASSTMSASTSAKIERPPNPRAYGSCYGAIFAWAKKSGGQITNQRAVDFFNTWRPYAAGVSSAAAKAGGCAGNYNDSELLQCYNKRLPDSRDATFQWAYNMGLEPVMDANGAAAALIAQVTCGELIGYEYKSKTSSSTSSTPSSSSGTVTRVDTSTGNVSITGYSRVTVGKSTSVTVNGSRVKDEGDLMIGDKCTVRMEASDLYARNLICTR